MSEQFHLYYASDTNADDEYGAVSSKTVFTDDTENRKLFDLLITINDKAENEAAFDTYDQLDIQIADTLQSAFRTSLKLSNGSPLLQSLLHIRAAQILTFRTRDPQGLAELARQLPLDMKRFAIPARHEELDQTRRSAPDRAQTMWQFFMKIVQHPNDPDQLCADDEVNDEVIERLQIFGTFNFAPFAIAHYMIGREIEYMDRGRPNRDSQASRYRSLIRECGFLKKPSGNPELDVAMQEVRTIIATVATINQVMLPDFWLFTDIKPQFETLQQKWEDRHGVNFIPETVQTVDD